MMTAEKAADLILGDTPLPPQAIPFYRHEGAAATGVAAARLSAVSATRPGSPCGPSSCRFPGACAADPRHGVDRERRYVERAHVDQRAGVVEGVDVIEQPLDQAEHQQRQERDLPLP